MQMMNTFKIYYNRAQRDSRVGKVFAWHVAKLASLPPASHMIPRAQSE